MGLSLVAGLPNAPEEKQTTIPVVVAEAKAPQQLNNTEVKVTPVPVDPPAPPKATPSVKYPDNACVIAMKKVFPSEQWATAEAIMKAESGLRPDAVGGPNKNGTYDYGCWQINNTERALNPDEGTKIAWYKYQHSGWSPWTVWKNGKYRRFL